MSGAYSIDEIARTSEDAVVRARFNAATLTALRFLSIGFTLVAFPHMVEAGTTFRRVLGVVSFVLGIVIFLLVRKGARNRVAVVLQQRARAVGITFAIVQAALLLTFNANSGNQSIVAIATIYPIAVVLYRLLPPEHVLLHASLTAMSILAVVLMPLRQLGRAELLAPPIIVNVVSLVVALLISRRIRRRIRAEWNERRVSAREQIRMRDELRYARELQLSMLPEAAPRLSWADISSLSIPATEVGGDYFDYFETDGRVALVCGDVAGHGMASGIVLSALRSGFILLRDSLDDPASVLHRLHDVVTYATRRRMLVTVSVMLLDPSSRRALVASAGHPPIVICRTDGSVATLNLYAPPLGVRLPVVIPQRQIEFSTGDIFVLHSDGIYETRNAADEVYGLERLQNVVRDHRDANAESLRDAILQDLTEFRGTREQDDDVTVVVCRITQ